MRALMWIVAAVVAALVFFFVSERPGRDETSPSPEPEATSPAVQPAPTIGMIDDARINAAASEPGNWLASSQGVCPQAMPWGEGP